jgi:hypothetical protein
MENEYMSDAVLTGRSLSKISGAAHRTAWPSLIDPPDPESVKTVQRPKSVRRA